MNEKVVFSKVCLLSLLLKPTINCSFVLGGKLLKCQLLSVKLLGDRIYSPDLNACKHSEFWIAKVVCCHCKIALCYQYANSNEDVLHVSHECLILMQSSDRKFHMHQSCLFFLELSPGSIC